MRAFTSVLAALWFTACVTHQPTEARSFEAAKSPIGQQRDPSIEDYILALPPYAFHEGPVSSFAATVRRARALPQNQGKSRDYLYCPGDGTWPEKVFVLDRPSRRLTIQVGAGPEPEAAPYTTTMRRVRGGW